LLFTFFHFFVRLFIFPDENSPVTKRGVSPIIKLIADIRAKYDCVLNTKTEEKYLLAPDEYFRSQAGEFWI